MPRFTTIINDPLRQPLLEPLQVPARLQLPHATAERLRASTPFPALYNRGAAAPRGWLPAGPGPPAPRTALCGRAGAPGEPPRRWRSLAGAAGRLPRPLTPRAADKGRRCPERAEGKGRAGSPPPPPAPRPRPAGPSPRRGSPPPLPPAAAAGRAAPWPPALRGMRRRRKERGGGAWGGGGVEPPGSGGKTGGGTGHPAWPACGWTTAAGMLLRVPRAPGIARAFLITSRWAAAVRLKGAGFALGK